MHGVTVDTESLRIHMYQPATTAIKYDNVSPAIVPESRPNSSKSWLHVELLTLVRCDDAGQCIYMSQHTGQSLPQPHVMLTAWKQWPDSWHLSRVSLPLTSTCHLFGMHALGCGRHGKRLICCRVCIEGSEARRLCAVLSLPA